MSDESPPSSHRAHVTATVRHIVWIEVKGEDAGNGVYCDDGLSGRLLRWLAAEGISPKAPGRTGGGAVLGGYDERDAKRIVAWLRSNGVGVWS